MLSDGDRTAVEQLFAGADRSVRVLVLADAGGVDPEFLQVLEDVAGLVPSVSVEQRRWQEDDAPLSERAPAVVLLDGDGEPLGVRFSGLPHGLEFSAFVQAVADAAKGGGDLAEASRQALAALTGDVNIKVFTTPT